MAKTDTDSAKVTNIDNITVSAAVLGDLFGVTDRRIRQMAEEGIVARAAKGRYKLVESIKNYLLTLKLAAEGAAWSWRTVKSILTKKKRCMRE